MSAATTHIIMRLGKIGFMIERLSLAFTGPNRTVAYDRDRADREIIKSRAHGNIRLQQGQFYTKKDVDAKFQSLQAVGFTD